MKSFFLAIALFFNPNYHRSNAVPDQSSITKSWDSSWDKIIIDSLSTKELLKKFNPDPKYWVSFLRALAKAESGLNLNERYVETGLGKDALTGLQNTSEGLLQLSYQDSKFHGCGFNWNLDKKLDPKDLRKTIFDPKLNLECGMIILDKQLKVVGALYTDSPYYWAVLNKTNPRHKIFIQYLIAENVLK